MDTEKSEWQADDKFNIPGREIPSWRTSYAVQQGVENNILMRGWGGIGDEICAEPTYRFALQFFKDCEITLATGIPEVFGHLKFKDIYDTRKETPIFDDYLVFETNSEASVWNLKYQFFCHNVMQAVDFASQSALRCQLPIENRNIVLMPPMPPSTSILHEIVSDHRKNMVVVHAGKHWQSKTFPKSWWDRALDGLVKSGLKPVLIGKESGDGQGTVNVDTAHCIDLRNRTTLNETIWLLQQTPAVLCNDSSPLHMAVSGNAFIAFIATAKHQDFITHWRRNLIGKNDWSWRMQHFNKGGMWDLMDFCPNKQEEKTLDKVSPRVLESWLPEPEVFGPWCVEKINEYFAAI